QSSSLQRASVLVLQASSIKRITRTALLTQQAKDVEATIQGFNQRSSQHKAIIVVGVAVSLYATRYATNDKGHGHAQGKGERFFRQWLRGQGSNSKE
ncbi:hypothetical protein OC834_007317, partial [Tilletia horrida]